MALTIEPKNFYWWIWVVTIGLIAAAISGWAPGYYAVMVLSAVQIVLFLLKEKNVFAFPIQIRVVYFCLTLFGLWKVIQLPFYILLLFSTFMGVFMGRCTITLLLKYASWNRNRVPRMY